MALVKAKAALSPLPPAAPPRAGMPAEIYIRTDKGARDYRLVTAPVATPDAAHWQEFVPHRAGTKIQGIDLFRDFAVVSEKSNALNTMRFYNFQTKAWKTLSFP